MQYNDSSKAETSSIINKTETKEIEKTRRKKRRKAIRMRKIDRVIIEKRSFEASRLECYECNGKEKRGRNGKR